MSRPSEDELIAEFFAPLAGLGAFGLRDDAASLAPPPGCDLVLTKDMLVAGEHFFPDDPPESIARKALRVNLSDLAAKAAEPQGFLLGLALPVDWTEDWLAAFARGLGGDAEAYGCPLLGGDTVKTPGPLTLSVTAFGAAPRGRMIPRGGAAAGDLIYATGTIGDAALGLQLRLDAAEDRHWTRAASRHAKAYLADRYLLPQPRLALREPLRAHAHAAMDISDGLAGDLAKMLRLAGLTAEIEASALPLSDAAREVLMRAPDVLPIILGGGDDYEILCAIPPERRAAFEAAAAAAGCAVCAIGEAAPGLAPPAFKDQEGKTIALAKASYQHF
ncbi:thiamine-phosphate kinase [Methylocapsa acidiphila]|uniref:thiamine-phosphate kinase n=1 Tax=Methylocapsa acidiphila TaxID=133552 RepID=UPI00041E1B14|nr:thiamine-phosphate kinase [Methylocapsa acidiphila]